MKNEYKEYDELLNTGYATHEETPPEDEFFHAIYISSVMRKNHISVIEEVGKLQIRGVQYNLNEVNFVITHVKPVLVKKEKINEKDKIVCFSYQNTRPWKGNSGHICPTSRDERDNTPVCKGCRGEIIVSGMLCDQNGTPIINDGKPIFVFVRGKGIKSMNVYAYLDKLTKIETEPPIFPDNPTLEKMIAKNKRYVTRVAVTSMNSKYGVKTVFSFDTGTRLSDESVREVLKIQKKTLIQFNEKFDWSNNFQLNSSNKDNDSSSGHVSEQTQPTPEPTQPQPTPEQPQNSSESFSFDNIKF